MSLSIFVDAGYLFKQGARATLNSNLGRHQVFLDGKRFTEDLCAWISRRYPSDGLLRTYWYDGARQGVATSDQLDVAALSFVKLRLGRINSLGQQKGVDTLIVRDLMVLSQERSIRRAVVLSGDEDLREGIEYAQDRGVQVAVVGIEADRGSQSLELVREADEHLILPAEILEEALSRKTPTTAAGKHRRAITLSAYVSCAQEFAREWLARATTREVGTILADRPRIPGDLDAALLEHVARALGTRSIEAEPRGAMRAAFWLVVEPEADAGEP